MSDPKTQAFSLAILEAYEASKSVIGASCTVTANTGATASLLHDEPPRPSRDVLDIFPGLLPFVARNEWLEKCNQELLDEKADSDQKRIAAEVKLAAITLEMKETLKEIENKTMALKKCEEELRIKTLKTRRNVPTVRPNADIYDAIQSLGDWMEDAKYCEPTIKIIKLQAHVHAEKEKHRKKYSRQMRVLNENAEELKQSATRHVTIARALGEERAVFDEEQEKWRMQKAQELEGTELEAVQELWLSTQEERVKAEVKKQTEIEVQRTMEPHIRAEEGYNVGISDGFTIGLAAGEGEGARERGETNQQSYERGQDEGHPQGHYKGYAKGFAQGLDAFGQEEGGIA
ncbi:unnamed protein product [Alternaria alternata]